MLWRCAASFPAESLPPEGNLQRELAAVSTTHRGCSSQSANWQTFANLPNPSAGQLLPACPPSAEKKEAPSILAATGRGAPGSWQPRPSERVPGCWADPRPNRFDLRDPVGSRSRTGLQLAAEPEKLLLIVLHPDRFNPKGRKTDRKSVV